MIHVYGVIDGTQPDVAVTGIDGVTVEIIVADPLGVAASRHASSNLPPTSAATHAHTGVCEALQASGSTVLPVRFGLRYPDERALRHDVTARAGAFVGALRHVRGRVEIDVRMAERDAAAEVPASLAAMTSRSGARLGPPATHEVAQAAASEIHEQLRGSAVDSVTNPPSLPGILLSAAYLVPTDHVRTFEARIAELARARTDLQLLWSGPCPPYHFTGELA